MFSDPRIHPSLPEYTPLFNKFICATSHNLPLPPRIYPPLFNVYDPPRIYPSRQEYTLLFNKFICAILPESNPLPEYTPFSATICDPPRINPSLSEYMYIPLFNNYVRPSQNLPLPPRIIPTFSTTVWNPPRNLPPFSTNSYMRHSQTRPLPPIMHPPLFNNYIYVTLPESTLPSQSISLPLRIYTSSFFYNYMRYSKNLPLSHWIYPLTTCICEWANLPLVPGTEKYSGREG